MNKVNRKLEYALMALKYMSSKTPGELTSVKEVVESLGCPFDATARVMQLMAQKEWLKSEQGAYGGYVLIKDLSKVSLHQLIEIVSGPLEIVKCVQAIGECDLSETCNIKSPLYELNLRLSDFYKSVTVRELLKVNNSENSQLLKTEA